MSRLSAQTLQLLSFLAIAACCAVAQLAPGRVEPGTERAFAASYRLTRMVDVGSEVSVTMRLTLQNPSNADVNGGIVAVLTRSGVELLAPPVLLTSFAPIRSLPRLQRTTISKTFTLPAAELARWQAGHEPVMEFLVPGKEGAVAEGIQVHQEPAHPLATD